MAELWAIIHVFKHLDKSPVIASMAGAIRGNPCLYAFLLLLARSARMMNAAKIVMMSLPSERFIIKRRSPRVACEESRA